MFCRGGDDLRIVWLDLQKEADMAGMRRMCNIISIKEKMKYWAFGHISVNKVKGSCYKVWCSGYNFLNDHERWGNIRTDIQNNKKVKHKIISVRFLT